MKILYFDCFSGISGDMAIGALLDLGIEREVFLKELSGLGLDGYKIEIGTKTVNGIRGTDVNVILTESGQESVHEHEDECGHRHGSEGGHGHGHEGRHAYECSPDHGHSSEHDHDHEHGHAHDGHGHNHGGHDHTHTHGERGLAEIEQIIDRSSLSENIKAFSKKVFGEIAAAEAKVHGKPINEVHFHEVGAVDSIVDIAGTAICLELLGVDRIYSSALHDGSGFIECRHGMIPVPVPAVLEMLKGSGIPLISEDVGTELVTPTGMGLIKCLASGFGNRPPMLVEKTGYGHGKRDIGRLNALRVILGESYDEKTYQKEQNSTSAAITGSGSDRHGDEVIVLETNIDDTTAEILGYTLVKLLEAGALDAFYTPVYMKKSRPAYMLTVLASSGAEDSLAEIILSETSTLGIRTRSVKRYCMERKTLTVGTPFGDARIKVASLGGIQKASPEYEDCRKIAESAGMPLAKAYSLVVAEAAKQYDL